MTTRGFMVGVGVLLTILILSIAVPASIPIPGLSSAVDLTGEITAVEMRTVSGVSSYSVADVTIDGVTVSVLAEDSCRFRVGDTVQLKGVSCGGVCRINVLRQIEQ